MDRAIVFWVLLLVAVTWLLYRLAVLLEPRCEKPAAGPHGLDAKSDAGASNYGNSSREPIHQRLRK